MSNTICVKCIMDYSDPDLVIDSDGICNHCRRYVYQLDKRVFTDHVADLKLKELVQKIKNRYDTFIACQIFTPGKSFYICF